MRQILSLLHKNYDKENGKIVFHIVFHTLFHDYNENNF